MSKNRTNTPRRGESEGGAGSESTSGDVFDLKRISRLVELMKEHDLGEIDLAQGDQKIRLRRGGEVVVTGPAPAPLPSAAAKAAAPAPAAAESSPNLAMIKSEMVGTFYSASSPETPPFVKVGDHVGPDTIVCIVEAMKVFNEIPAGISGKIVAVMAQNGDPVDFNSVLFKVDTTQ
ncbi:MAG: acetyl-CoA carboxylase biotin carboxyl carrier protein [Planctomycetes bacterium]|nr:acetyl-CoA carboxylase biotin carboxyl carrier protein [Planctomycetota bacterium]